jgi:hypothetical protein
MKSKNNKRTNKTISKAAQKRQRQENQTKITGGTCDNPLSLETIQNEQPLERQTLQTEENIEGEQQPVGTIIHINNSNKKSWVWEFFKQEMRKEETGWQTYTICTIEVALGVECGRAYRTGSSTGNLSIHLSAEHEVTQENPHPKEVRTIF